MSYIHQHLATTLLLQDNAQVFPILENYLLLNAGGSLDAFSPIITAALSTTVNNAVGVLLASVVNPAVSHS